MRISQVGAGNNNATSVLQYDKQGNFLGEFSTTKEAAVKFGKNSNHIPEVCRGNEICIRLCLEIQEVI